MLEAAIKEATRTVKDWPKPGINFRDITTLFEKPAVMADVYDALAEWTRAEQFGILAGIDARGFLLAGALGDRLRLPLILIRKKGKLPYRTVEQAYELEYGQAVIETHETEIIRRQKVLIVDDLLATGGTALAAAALLRHLGAAELGFAAILNLVELPGETRLREAGLTLNTLASFTESE